MMQAFFHWLRSMDITLAVDYVKKKMYFEILEKLVQIKWNKAWSLCACAVGYICVK